MPLSFLEGAVPFTEGATGLSRFKAKNSRLTEVVSPRGWWVGSGLVTSAASALPGARQAQAASELSLRELRSAHCLRNLALLATHPGCSGMVIPSPHEVTFRARSSALPPAPLCPASSLPFCLCGDGFLLDGLHWTLRNVSSVSRRKFPAFQIPCLV